MTNADLEYEALRWDAVSRTAALLAQEAERVRSGLLMARRSDGETWEVPGGTRREADRARRTAAMLSVVSHEINA